MTIAIGVLCKDGIVVGSDSRTTLANSSIRDDATKIRTFKMRGVDYAIVAHAGDDDLGSRVMDGIEQAVKDVIIEDWQTVSALAEKVIGQEIHRLKIPFLGPTFKMEEFQDVLRGFDSTFMLVHYCDGKPYLFTTDFYPGRFSRRTAAHYSIGCGSPLANFLLDGFDFSTIDANAVAPILAYIIGEVKKFDPRCGGPTNIAGIAIYREMRVVINGEPNERFQLMQQPAQYSQELITEFLDDISKLRVTIRNLWTKTLQEITAKLLRRWVEWRSSYDRFVRLRYGDKALASLKSVEKYIQEQKNDAASKLLKSFNEEIKKAADKITLESLWTKICEDVPSVVELPNVGKSFPRYFDHPIAWDTHPPN